MEGVPLDLHLGEVLFRDPFPRGVVVGIELGMNVQTGLSGRVANQVHDHFMTDKRPTAPILGDVGKHPMLDLVPLAGTRGQVADRDP